MKLGRNDKCWCGSGKKYKACHMAMDEKIYEYQIHGAVVPDHDMIKTKEQIDGIRRAGEINTQVLDYISEYVKVGVNTEELDRRIDEYTRKLGGIPACLGYQGYPKSVCISPNEVI
ncbi:MAG: methionyl aminopeptidase, partial [Lachnospiraceae bacterium]|nr:methionyl aminopeptidase [Lachnospiraceae bacterium]